MSSTARFAKREKNIAGAQDEICIGPVLKIEERIAPDRDRRIGLGEGTSCMPISPSAHIRAHGFREHANADLELRRHLIKHGLQDRGHARHHDYIGDPKAQAPLTPCWG